MNAFKRFLIFLLSFISIVCLFFILIDYFDFFKQSKFDLENRYNRKDSPLLIAGSASIAGILEDLAYTNIVATSADAQPINDYYKNLSSIGFADKPNFDLIKKLQADFYLSDYTLKAKLDVLFDKENIDALELKFFDFSTYEKCLESFSKIGELINREKEADRIIQTIEAKILEIKRSHYGVESPRVLLLFQKNNFIFLGTKHSFLGSFLECLNIKNIADEVSELSLPFLLFDFDQIDELEPDIIIFISDDDTGSAFDLDCAGNFALNNYMKRNNFISKKRIYSLKKDKNIKFYYMNQNTFTNSKSLEISDIAEKLDRIVYLEPL